MSERRPYLKPSWFERRVIGAAPGAASLMSRLTGDAVLRVRGRRSGRVRTTLARPITVGGSRYLVAITGETQWARNLRAASEAMLRQKGDSRRITAMEVHGTERQAVFDAFLASSRIAATRRILTEVLPDSGQHPVFKIQPFGSDWAHRVGAPSRRTRPCRLD
jgi:deazaflavin-dependent oxidoreductase (nitroreductase family)